MNRQSVMAMILTAVILAACSGVEMVPAPQATAVPNQPAAGATQMPPGTAIPDPTVKQTPPGGIVAFDATPNPALNQPVPFTPSAGLAALATLQPQPGDDKMEEGKAFLDEYKLVDMQAAPSGKGLNLTGNLPTPCHQLRVRFEGPDSGKRIRVSVYSVTNPEMICAQVLEPFDVTLPLDAFPAGSYSVEVNGEKAGDLTIR